jgi:WD40 repeat protein
MGGHTAHISRLAFCADGAVLASASGDKTVRLWSLPEGSLLDVLEGHAAVVTGVSFTPDGSMLVSSSSDGTIRHWESDVRSTIEIPIANTTLKDCNHIEEILEHGDLGDVEREWFQFVFFLMRWKWREAPVIEEMPTRIEVGDFDIEIAEQR